MSILKLWFLWLKISALESTIDGRSKCLECVRDPEVISRMIDAQMIAERELYRLRREYTARRQSIERATWRTS